MCGIIGIIGETTVTDRLVVGLKRLEYRGYDSAGIALLNHSELKRVRAKGKIVALEEKLQSNPIDGPVGIAHTRWATHGVPNETNAHPHFSGRVGVVHNGIIENYQDLRAELKGRNFQTETDTEVIAHVMDDLLSKGLNPKAAFAATLKKLRGAYALAAIVDGDSAHIYAARAGSPLAIGVGETEMYLGSDALALAELSSQLVYLEEGDWAVIRRDGYEIYDENDNSVTRYVTQINTGPTVAKKGDYDHFMLKEIYEQPETLSDTISTYLDRETGKITLPHKLDFPAIDRIVLVACGTASYAALVAKYWFEQLAGLAVDVDIASEFRYRDPVLSTSSLFIAVSQSGETADTLAALRYCKDKGLKTAALVNVMTSSMAREADLALPIKAGPEIGVASTKAFTSQLAALLALALAAAKSRKALSGDSWNQLISAYQSLPLIITSALEQDFHIAETAKALKGHHSAFFLGRGVLTPIALEGALKLKEISYIHAEGYASGELKHGPIALIEDGTPVIVIAPKDHLFEKTISNMQEVISRGAIITLITDKAGAKEAGHMAKHVITLPETHTAISPIVMTIGVQLLAYHAAVHLGRDVDQPRNLAKSVTVE